MSSAIIRSQLFDANNITYSKVQKRDSGARNVKMSYNDSKIMIQLDNVKVPFGISCYDKDSSKLKYSLELSLGGNENMENFKNTLDEIDQANIDQCVLNSEEWWKTKMKKDGVKDFVYNSLIKKDSKGLNPPRFKVKLPFYDGRPLFKVFNKDKKEVNIYSKNEETGEMEFDKSWATNGMEIKVLLECEGLWVMDKKLFCTWKVVQLRVLNSIAKDNYYMIDDDGESEESNVEYEEVSDSEEESE